MKVPSDLSVLEAIYEEYHHEFSQFSRGGENSRQTKVFVPVDCQKIAQRLGVDGDIVFGRLYYHLEQKHGYKRPDGSNVAFFVLQAGNDRRCVNFPLLASVLAGLQEEDSKTRHATFLAWFAIGVSFISVVATVLG